ncbi:MAG TPA: alternative ribosome rescue aminoacyl-tRNA hydrolase ArfB [Propioniciclava tarda]|nr:alternative ribosome rescue aminoacyl-tRNA hydrolase ArfB [Propioniciclava tarda]HQA30809.1 alternative ribosome rescue aminoacyl-tRNA hydrolase ArfB [Propioniciclava tarda]HQD61447.1 alternative ribosome rescue aminoacyl-tRNA hydrolase ArfB [Propioniciclava tarda]
MADPLRIPPAPGIPGGLVLHASEFTERFSHAGGPGGQGVNTADSRVQLSWDAAASVALSDAQRARLLTNLAGRLAEGVLTVDASEHRSQRRNRDAARDRLVALVTEALAPPPRPRRPTRPSVGARERRLEAKRRRSALKETRRPDWD